jgi:Peptidase C13 family
MWLFLSNLKLVLRAICFRRLDFAALRPTPAQISAAVALDMVAVGLIELWAMWPVGGISLYGISTLFSATFISLAGLTIGAMLTRRSGLIAALLLGVFLSTLISYSGLLALAAVLPQDVFWAYVGAIAGCAILILPSAIFVIRLYLNSGRASVWRGIFASALLFGLQFGGLFALPGGTVWEPDYGQSGDYADYVPPEVERIYYAQPSLLNAQAATLRPGNPDQIEIYALIVGGTAEQNVFLHEAESVGGILATTYETTNRMLTLVNSSEAPDRYPLANTYNISTSLAALATAMNPEQDILLVYLTSHGAPDLFSLSFYEFGTQDMSALALKQMLADSGIVNTAIVISACKSGSFIDDLSADNRLIITAASASRNSFGCANDRDWTWWGEAYFERALAQTNDLRAAFPIARDLIESWETRDNQLASEPQINTGAGFDIVMDAYLAQQARVSIE